MTDTRQLDGISKRAVKTVARKATMAKRSANYRAVMVNRVMTAVLAVAVIAVIGFVGSQDTEASTRQLHGDMIATCNRSYQVMDGDLEEACARLIERVQASGEYRVSTGGGSFKVEGR